MKEWEWKVTWFLVAFLAVVWLAVQSSKPCTLSFEVHKGQNFNQPLPTYRHGVPGDQCIQTTDIYGKPFNK